jgi:hypothetical protein
MIHGGCTQANVEIDVSQTAQLAAVSEPKVSIASRGHDSSGGSRAHHIRT